MSATNTRTAPTVSFCQTSFSHHSQSLSFAGTHVQAVASLNSIGVCRICFEDESKEKLISPCNCTGTMGLLHQSCIETWLGSSSRNKCEICNFTYITERKPKSLKQWFSAPTHRLDRRNFIGDSLCFCFLTPLATVSAWLCTSGAVTYAQYRGYEWETAGLAVLAVSLVVIYFVWVMIALRYHSSVIADWRQMNQEVHIVNMNDRNLGSDSSSSVASTTFLPAQCSTSSLSDTGSNQLSASVTKVPDVNIQGIRELGLGKESESTSTGHTTAGLQKETGEFLQKGSTFSDFTLGSRSAVHYDDLEQSQSHMSHNMSSHCLSSVPSNQISC